MKIKLLFDPETGKVKSGLSAHAMMTKARQFDRMVRAIYFPDRNVVYFRYWAPDGTYEFTSWGAKKAEAVCRRALRAFDNSDIVPHNAKILFWETGHGVSEQEITY